MGVLRHASRGAGAVGQTDQRGAQAPPRAGSVQPAGRLYFDRRLRVESGPTWAARRRARIAPEAAVAGPACPHLGCLFAFYVQPQERFSLTRSLREDMADRVVNGSRAEDSPSAPAPPPRRRERSERRNGGRGSLARRHAESGRKRRERSPTSAGTVADLIAESKLPRRRNRH